MSFVDLSSHLYALDKSYDDNVGFYFSQSAHELDKDMEERIVAACMDRRNPIITGSCNNQQD